MNDGLEERRGWSMHVVIAVLLFVITFALYARVLEKGFSFLLFDDHLYVTHNPAVKAGLSGNNVLWAFDLNTAVAANWHPLTLISHMIDCDLFGVEDGQGLWGLGPRGHHLTNIVLHSINTALLFLVLSWYTGSRWASALVAALFGWHPVHVESVAWVSERKDVLSTLFWLLTMWAYLGYVRRNSIPLYLLSLIFLMLGLLAKPMLVTLPCVLLLMDVWPLGRLRENWFQNAGRVVFEKVPMFALAAFSSYMTIQAQKTQAALATLVQVPWLVRVLNPVYAYNVYIFKLLAPYHLAPYYPIEGQHYTDVQLILGLLGILLVTALTLLVARSVPYLTIGWLWYVGTLVPVIGIVQVGGQAYADRYTYIPSIGIFLIVAFGLRDLASRAPVFRYVGVAAATLALIACSVYSFVQIGIWKDTETLFTYTLSVTERNQIAHITLGTSYHEDGRYDDALSEFEKALSINPTSGSALYNKASTLRRTGKLEEAILVYNEALKYQQNDRWKSYGGLGMATFDLGRYDEAKKYFAGAIRSNPNFNEGYVMLARALIELDEIKPAVEALDIAVRRMPTDFIWMARLARILATHEDDDVRNPKMAKMLVEHACQLCQNRHPKVLDTAAAVHAELGDYENAIKFANAAMQLSEALSVAAAERHEEKVSADWHGYAQEVEKRLELYRRGLPYREDPKEYHF